MRPTYMTLHRNSVLKAEPDGMGFYYGFTPENHRIDIRWEQAGEADVFGGWVSYVSGDKVGKFDSLQQAEMAAVSVSKELGDRVQPEEPSWAMKIWKRLSGRPATSEKSL